MIDPELIDADHSISSGWLKGKFPLIDFIQWLAAILLAAALLFLLLYYTLQAWSLELKTFTYALGIGLVFAAYWLYRTLTVNRLYKVDTMMLAKDIRPLLMEYFTKQNLQVEFDAEDKLVFLDPGPPAFLYQKHTKYIIILYKNCTLRFCIMGDAPVRFPQLFPPWFTKKELSALLN